MQRVQWVGVVCFVFAVVVSSANCGQAAEMIDPQVAALQRQVELLERAFAPQSYWEAVEKWAAGVQTRNGAAQFAVLSSELRERTRSKYEAMMWVTGTSSPWVAEWIVVDEKVLRENAVAFTVRFELAASTGPVGAYTVELEVSGDGEQYYITRLSSEAWAFR